MSTLAMLFAGGTDSAVPELTNARSMASVPFGCRYRLIDFTLSNLVNAGISHVAILTQHNYQSLMDHLGSGKEWDLARRNGGLDILPPFFTVMGPQASQANLFSSSLEGLLSARNYLEGCPEDTVILSDCESVNNLDVGSLLKQHEETGADLTIAVCRSVVQPGSENVEIVRSDRDGRVKEVFSGNDSSPGKKDVSMRLFAVNKRVLLNIMTDMSVRRYTDLARDFLARNAGRYHFRIYRHEGYHRTIGSLAEYFARNMELLDENVREQLFRVPDRPVLTKVHNSVPAVYKDGSLVRNSMIADGCVIEGIVENCILFRGVRVGKNTSVENCILMQDTTVEDGVYMNCVITDKNVRIREGRVLSGHQNKPFYIGKNGDV